MSENFTSTKIQDQKVDQKRFKVPKQHYSNFLITVNTNSTDPGIKDILKEAVESMYESLEEFLIYKDPDKATFDDISEVNGEGVIEVGPKTGYIHAHYLVNVVHETSIQLNLKYMRQFIGDQLGIPETAFHLNVRVVRGQQNVREYLRKAIGR